MQDPGALSPLFYQESLEQLALVEELVLELEEAPDNAEVTNQLFRIFHTIKGSSAMFGYDDIAAFTHQVEGLLAQLREKRVRISHALVDLVLACKDQLLNLLESHGDQQALGRLKEAETALLKRLAELTQTPACASVGVMAGVLSTSGVAPGQGTQTGLHAQASHRYHIHFQPECALFQRGVEPAAIFAELARLGTCRVRCDEAAVPLLAELEPESCLLRWEILLATEVGVNAVKDVFIFVEEDSSIRIHEMATEEPFEFSVGQPSSAGRAAGPGLTNAGLSMPSERIISAAAPVGSCQAECGSPLPVGASSLASSSPAQASAQAHANAQARDYVRVPAQRLDRLVRLVGELVSNRSRLAAISNQAALPELAAGVEDLERLVSELRDNVLGIRMTPIESTFVRFRRLVRDLSVQLGKEVDFVTEGGETELDKTLLDQLGDTLVHLLRNAMDHGIATPAAREARGKPRRGRVLLSARHEGAQVLLEIEDDGDGPDREAIRQRAVEMGLLAPTEALTEEQLCAFMLMPGFSTARQVSSVSGRGVGLDAVRRQVEALRGQFLLSSQPGQGLRITLRLPLTLAIIDGLLVGVGGGRYLLPMSGIQENLEMSEGSSATGNGRNLLSLRGELIPFLRLRDLFHVRGTRPAIERVVIVRLGARRLGLVVDGIEGMYQVVIQPLSRFYRSIRHFSGSTILGDGKVALILDLGGLLDSTLVQGGTHQDHA